MEMCRRALYRVLGVASSCRPCEAECGPCIEGVARWNLICPLEAHTNSLLYHQPFLLVHIIKITSFNLYILPSNEVTDITCSVHIYIYIYIGVEIISKLCLQ